MKLKNIESIKESLSKFTGEDYKHYFTIEKPEWDSQYIYRDIYYNCNSDNMHGYIEAYGMIYEEEVEFYVNEIKREFNLPVYEWKRVMIEYGK